MNKISCFFKKNSVVFLTERQMYARREQKVGRSEVKYE